LIALWHGNADDSVLDRYVRQRRTVNIEYVQESSIRNKRLLEETDPTLRKQRLDEMRRASETPALAKEVVMKSSMIASMRRAFKSTLEDAEFIAQANRLRLDITYVSPEEIDKWVNEVLTIPPQVRENLQFLSQSK